MTEMVIKSKPLAAATSKILTLTASMRENAFTIAHVIAEVNDKELYKADGFESVHAWTEYSFGYKKSTSYRLLKIGHEYTRALAGGRYDCDLLPEDAGTNFTISQVDAMLSLDKPIVEGLVADGYIAPEMTVRDIKAVVKAQKDADKPEPEPVEDSEHLENGMESEQTALDDEPISVTDPDGNVYEVPAHILLPYRIS